MPELLHLTFSHYNEKARWALDLKGLPHTRRGFDQLGPHREPVQALTGATFTPVLVDGDDVIEGSTTILEWLDAAVPEPRLFPREPELLSEVRALVEWFDEPVGPAIRSAFVQDIIQDVAYAEILLGDFASRIPSSAERRDAALATTFEALERVAEAGEGYLVGDRFTAADLTAASILSMALYPSAFPYEVQRRGEAPAAGWFARFAGHPGVAWVQRMYDLHRV